MVVQMSCSVSYKLDLSHWTQFYILCDYRFNKLFVKIQFWVKNIFESRVRSGNNIYS